MTAIGRLSRREKVLLALCFLVAVPLALWALVAVPLQESRDRAVAALAGAQADYIWVAEKAQQYAAMSQPSTGPVGIAGLEAALMESGLRQAATALETAPNGNIRLQIRNVPFDTLGRFLDAAGQELGYAISELTIDPTDSAGQVNASLGFEPF
ncbi:type II secretion system protein M (GspM) [Roseivivax lentus]|uniref:Type II secretion system protein M (GspM) n=1 Tax=Roseivivax lentus TaxID=633194 RepID=A0A1N7NB46_9RHOB|nr:type II secretion system protein GspM [Roseivivax lentus]SIS95441.1 type II secretion system protein M (GspM) [Roseivivax lentus]